MPIQTLPYDRRSAVEYAHRWAYLRNPAYFDFEKIGGDCTNFASQALYAGSGVMNFTPTFGWYYIDANQKSPSWTGVPFFYNFLLRGKMTDGPYGIEVPIEYVLPGDFVQINFDGTRYAHTPIIVDIGTPKTFENTLVAAHSVDADWRPLSSYTFQAVRFIHIIGVWKNED